MSLSKKIAHNTAIHVVGKLTYTLFSIIIIMLITRYFGVAGYGEYNIVIVFVGFFVSLGDLGLYMLMVREISTKGFKKEIISNIFGLRIATGLIIFILASILCLVFPYPGIVKISIIFFAISAIFSLLNQLLVGIFQIKLNIFKTVIADIISRGLVLVVLAYSFKFLNLNLIWVVIISLLGVVVGFLINFLFANHYVKINPKFNIQIWKKYLSQSLPIGIVLVLGLVFFKIDTLMLSVLPLENVKLAFAQGLSNTEAVGFYGVPYRILEVFVSLPALFLGLVYPVLVKILNKKNKTNARKILQKVFNFLLFVGFSIAITAFILAPQIIEVVAGYDFDLSALPLRILIISLVFVYLANITGYIFVAINKQKALIKPYLFYCLFNIVLNLFMIPYFSFIGAAIATVLSQALMLFYNFYLVNKFIKFKPNLEKIYSVIGSSIFIIIIFMILLNSEFFIDLFFSSSFAFKIIETSILFIFSIGLFWLFLYIFNGFDKKTLKNILLINKAKK